MFRQLSRKRIRKILKTRLKSVAFLWKDSFGKNFLHHPWRKLISLEGLIFHWKLFRRTLIQWCWFKCKFKSFKRPKARLDHKLNKWNLSILHLLYSSSLHRYLFRAIANCLLLQIVRTYRKVNARVSRASNLRIPISKFFGKFSWIQLSSTVFDLKFKLLRSQFVTHTTSGRVTKIRSFGTAFLVIGID